MTPAHVLLERVSSGAAFGVRFWDDALSAPVTSEYLEVILYPQFDANKFARVAAGPTGSYVTRRLPWTPDTGTMYNVEVSDRTGDFLPLRFSARLPNASLFQPDCASPSMGPFVPLFSSPQRNVPAAMGVFRAELWDLPNDRPAAWALVEFTPAAGMRPVRGMADARGCVAVPFGYPEPVRLPGLSPGSFSSLPLAQQAWDATFRVFYRAGNPSKDRADLCFSLQQPLATAWLSSAATVPFTNVLLRYGRELVVRTTDAANLKLMPRLLITGA